MASKPRAVKKQRLSVCASNKQSCTLRMGALGVSWSATGVDCDLPVNMEQFVDCSNALEEALKKDYNDEQSFKEAILNAFSCVGTKEQKHIKYGDTMLLKDVIVLKANSELFIIAEEVVDDQRFGVVLTKGCRTDISLCYLDSESNTSCALVMVELKVNNAAPCWPPGRDYGELAKCDSAIAQAAAYYLQSFLPFIRIRKGYAKPLPTAVISAPNKAIVDEEGRVRYSCVCFSLLPPQYLGGAWKLRLNQAVPFTQDNYAHRTRDLFLQIFKRGIEIFEMDSSDGVGMLGAMEGTGLIASPYILLGHNNTYEVTQGEFAQVQDADLVQSTAGKEYTTIMGNATNIQLNDVIKSMGLLFPSLASIEIVKITWLAFQKKKAEEPDHFIGLNLERMFRWIGYRVREQGVVVAMPKHDPFNRADLKNVEEWKGFLHTIYKQVIIPLLRANIVYMDLRPSLTNICKHKDGGHVLVDVESFQEFNEIKISKDDARYPPVELGAHGYAAAQLLNATFALKNGVSEEDFMRRGSPYAAIWKAEQSLPADFTDFANDTGLIEFVNVIRQGDFTADSWQLFIEKLDEVVFEAKPLGHVISN